MNKPTDDEQAKTITHTIRDIKDYIESELNFIRQSEQAKIEGLIGEVDKIPVKYTLGEVRLIPLDQVLTLLKSKL